MIYSIGTEVVVLRYLAKSYLAVVRTFSKVMMRLNGVVP